jgi:hypothetical protein
MAYKMYLQALCMHHKGKWEFKDVMQDFVKVFKIHSRSIRFLRGTRNYIKSNFVKNFDDAIENNFVFID